MLKAKKPYSARALAETCLCEIVRFEFCEINIFKQI